MQPCRVLHVYLQHILCFISKYTGNIMPLNIVLVRCVSFILYDLMCIHIYIYIVFLFLCNYIYTYREREIVLIYIDDMNWPFEFCPKPGKRIDQRHLFRSALHRPFRPLGRLCGHGVVCFPCDFISYH